MIRNAAVEGRFYPGTRKGIIKGIKDIENKRLYPIPQISSGDVIGGILPHAGHVYSGHQTVPFFKYLLEKSVSPETIIILHPNHTGLGAPLAVDENTIWRNSVGDLLIDKELSSTLSCTADSLALKQEHSAEVILPFIQHYFPDNDLMILPICLQPINTDAAKGLAKELVEGIRNLEREAIVIASSDFSHFLSPDDGFNMDQKVLSMIDKKDIDGLRKTIADNRISVCGYTPIMVLMAYAELIDPNYSSRIIARGHSGDIHPSPEVVDYISLLFQTNDGADNKT